VDTRQFIASLVSSLAWPVAFVVVALLFRDQLVRWLQSRRRAEVVPVPVEPEPREPSFSEVLTRLQDRMVEIGVVRPAGATPEELHSDEVQGLLSLSATGAVVEGQMLVHRALRRLVYGDITTDGADVATMILANSAMQSGAISPPVHYAVQQLTYLRGLAANRGGGEVDMPQAMEYLGLVQAMLYALEHPGDGPGGESGAAAD
jgi:hypothetical protein